VNVLYVCEDYTLDQYVLQPILEAMFREIGRKAKIRPCMDPRFRGISQATNWERLREEVIKRYKGMWDCFLLIVDRDGDAGRRTKLDGLEARATEMLPGDRVFLAENAWQEVEVWVLAGHELPSAWAWKDVRADPNPKEHYFQPFAKSQGVQSAPGGGRRPLAREAATRYSRLRSRPWS
jgi:hypothetical protein